jgi:ankyrin repeat protein
MKIMKIKMDENLRGEMSSSSTKVKCPTINLNWILNSSIDESNEVKHLSFKKTKHLFFIHLKASSQFRQSLLPWMIATCAQTDDIATLHQIQQAQTGVNFNVLLPCGSMPIHVCAKYSAIKCADLLLRLANNDSMVNETDHVGFTPLFYAILQQNEDMIELLINNGATLTSTLRPSEIGMYLCNCVKNNQVNRLKAWHKAGADLDQADYEGRTPLLLVIYSNYQFNHHFFSLLGC